MINWMYFPKNRKLDATSSLVVDVFMNPAETIDSYEHDLKSNEVLAVVRPGLEKHRFKVEASKKKEDLIFIPVLFGANGTIEKAFNADAHLEEAKYIVEVEAGRAITNHQFLKDFFEACTMNDIDYLCIAVRNVYRKSFDFTKVCTFFEAMYASGRLIIPLKGILIIGY